MAFGGRLRILPLLAGAAMLLATPARADIYKYVDKYGRVYLTDRPDHSGYKKLVHTWKGWTEQKSRVAIENMARNRKKYTPTINYYARHLGMPLPLVHAVITAESDYDPYAVSRTGAVGLMQLMPSTARRYGVHDRDNPSENILGGTLYLRDLLRMFHYNLKLALAAYNAGEDTVKKFGNRIPPYAETREYVKTVLMYYHRYLKTMSSARGRQDDEIATTEHRLSE